MDGFRISLLSLLLVSIVVAQVPSTGRCPNVGLERDFDLNKFMGKWYEIERYFAYFEFGKKCVVTNFTPHSDGKFSVTTTATSKWTKRTKTTRGEGSADSAKLTVREKGLLFDSTRKYSVLATDHSSYAVLWSCRDFLGLFNTQFGWILSRGPTLDEDTRLKIYEKLDALGIRHSNFYVTDQANCKDNH